MLKWLALVLAALSLLAALLFGTLLHQWIDDVSGGRTSAAVVLWLGVLICSAAAVFVGSWGLQRLEAAIVHRRAKPLDSTLGLATMCRQDGRQLAQEAADERNRDVRFGYYCELGRLVREHLDLLWCGSGESLMQMSMKMKGLDLTTAKALMHAAHLHCDVEIGGPLGGRPNNDDEKMRRIQEAGYGGRCVGMILNQLIDVLSAARGPVA